MQSDDSSLLVLSATFIQALGYFAGATCTSCYVARRDVTLRVILIAGISLYAIHFFLLGARAAAAIELVNVAWQLFSIFLPRFGPRTRRGCLIGVGLAYGLATVICWEGPRSLVPAIACLWCAIAVGGFNGTPLRICLMICDALWLTNGILTGSQGGVLFAVAALSLNAYLISRRSRESVKARATPGTPSAEAA